MVRGALMREVIKTWIIAGLIAIAMMPLFIFWYFTERTKYRDFYNS